MKFVREIKNAKNISIEISWKQFLITWIYREYLEAIIKSDIKLIKINLLLSKTFKYDLCLDNINMWICERYEETFEFPVLDDF